MYGNSYTIVFEDAWNNRFIRNVEYTMEKLMIPGKYLRLIAPYSVCNPELELYLCYGERGESVDSAENVERALRVADSEYVDDKVKKEIRLKLLQYYYDTDDMRALDDYLTKISPEMLNEEERRVVMRFLVLRGNYDLASEWLREYGPYFMDAKLLVRLISPLMERSNMMEDEVLTAAAIYAFGKGKYNSTVLRYLSAYYRGMTKDMRDVWKAAKSFEVDCYSL